MCKYFRQLNYFTLISIVLNQVRHFSFCEIIVDHWIIMVRFNVFYVEIYWSLVANLIIKCECLECHFQIQFVVLINRQGKVRLTKWYSPYAQKERTKVHCTGMLSRYLLFSFTFSFYELIVSNYLAVKVLLWNLVSLVTILTTICYFT